MFHNGHINLTHNLQKNPRENYVQGFRAVGLIFAQKKVGKLLCNLNYPYYKYLSKYKMRG